MSGNLLDGLNPVTQTIDSGKALAKFLGMTEELPETITLANSARLTLSSKKDCYYMTTPKSCTCKAGTYGRMCRHRKAMESSPGILKNEWATGGNGPVMPSEEA